MKDVPNLDDLLMSRAELYRWGNNPLSELSEQVVRSASFRILQQDPERWDEELSNYVCSNWCVALRSTLSEAWEMHRTAQYILDNGPRTDLFQSEAMGRQYVATMVIRRLVQNMFREDVPAEERLM